MKFLSAFTASLMLGVATISVVTAPVAEAKKEKKKKAPKLKPSKAFIPPYQDGLKKIEAGDAAGIQAALAAMKAVAAKPDDNYLVGTFTQTAGKKLNDAQMQIDGLDILIGSSFTPAENVKILHFQKAVQAFNGLKSYKLAADSFAAAYENGLRQADVEANAARAFTLIEDRQNAIRWAKIATENRRAAGAAVPPDYFQLMASNAMKSNNAKILADTMQYIVSINPSSDYWHDAVVLYMRAQDMGSQDALDLLRLMRETKTLRIPQQYAEYVEMAGAIRYPVEVVGLLDEGFANGTIKKSDVSFSESYGLAKGRVAGLRSSWDRDEREALASSKGFLAMITGDAMLSAGDYARAAKMYEAALQKGNIVDRSGKNQADRAAVRLGIAQIKLGNYDAAKTALAKATGPVRKEIADFWLVYAENKAAPAPAAAPAAATEG